jgi:hypothetical protein
MAQNRKLSQRDQSIFLGTTGTGIPLRRIDLPIRYREGGLNFETDS